MLSSEPRVAACENPDQLSAAGGQVRLPACASAILSARCQQYDNLLASSLISSKAHRTFQDCIPSELRVEPTLCVSERACTRFRPYHGVERAEGSEPRHPIGLIGQEEYHKSSQTCPRTPTWDYSYYCDPPVSAAEVGLKHGPKQGPSRQLGTERLEPEN